MTGLSSGLIKAGRGSSDIRSFERMAVHEMGRFMTQIYMQYKFGCYSKTQPV
jgi:hypothetical protein